ncbi:MAG: hypothetical protein MHMPM18_003494 [Marteilia pararefringens]
MICSKGKKRLPFPKKCLFTLMFCELLIKCEFEVIEVIRQKLMAALDEKIAEGKYRKEVAFILMTMADISLHPFQELYNNFKGCVTLSRTKNKYFDIFFEF